jgi:hypothetical protein
MDSDYRPTYESVANRKSALGRVINRWAARILGVGPARLPTHAEQEGVAMATVTSKTSVRSRGLIFMVLLGLIRPCIAGDTDQPKQIIQKMYSELLRGNFAGDITSKKNRTKYFMPSLVRLYDASDAAEASGKPPCIDFNLQVNGQDFDARKLRKSLSIEQTSNDGTRVEVISKSSPSDTFRYEFVKDSGRWKISDVILPWGQRLSQITCSQSAKPF